MAYERELEGDREWFLELRDRRILWIIPIVALLYMVWLLFVLSTASPPVFPTDTWIFIGTAVFVVMIVFLSLLLVRTHQQPVVYPRHEFPEEGEPRQTAEPDVVTWPREEDEDALYVSHHIEVDRETTLKFRQKLEEDWLT